MNLADMPNLLESRENMGSQTCRFLVTIAKFGFPYFYEFVTEWILMKLRIFSKYGMINRALTLIFYLNEKVGKE